MRQGKIYFLIRLIFLASAFFFSNILFSQEICDNGIDDDRNGLIDLNDPGCQCHYQANTNLLMNPSFESYKHCLMPPYDYANNFDIPSPWKYGIIEDGSLPFYFNLSCSDDSTNFVYWFPGTYPQNGKGYIFLKMGGDISQEKSTHKEYIAQCLQSPLKKGVRYTITFYAGQFVIKSFPLKFGVFGNKDCNTLPIGGTAAMNGRRMGCPLNYNGWYQLGESSQAIDLGSGWEQIKIDFVPTEDINVLAIGPDCSIYPNNYYFFLDNFQLAETKEFHLQYIQSITGNPCIGGYSLQAPTIPNATFQWYKNGIAIVGQKNTTINIPDSSAPGSYQVRMITSSGCQLSEPFEVLMSPLLQIKMPKDTFVCANDTLQLGKNTGGISYTWRGLTDTIVNLFNSGSYFITASDKLGCKSNYTVQVSSQNCKLCDVYLPSGFTPNGDGLNDIFKGSSHCPIAEYHLVIYNRWGKSIFESSKINEGWNGILNGQLAETGAYVYKVSYKNSNTENSLKIVSGTVVLIR